MFNRKFTAFIAGVMAVNSVALSMPYSVSADDEMQEVASQVENDSEQNETLPSGDNDVESVAPGEDNYSAIEVAEPVSNDNIAVEQVVDNVLVESAADDVSAESAVDNASIESTVDNVSIEPFEDSALIEQVTDNNNTSVETVTDDVMVESSDNLDEDVLDGTVNGEAEEQNDATVDINDSDDTSDFNDTNDFPDANDSVEIEDSVITNDTNDADDFTSADDSSEVNNSRIEDENEAERTIDSDIQSAVDSGVFAFEGNKESEKVILLAKEEASKSDEVPLAEDESLTESGSGNDIDEDSKTVTVQAYTDPSKGNNSNPGEYNTADYTGEDGVRIILSGLTDANEDDSVNTILDYYKLFDDRNALDSYAMKVVNENYIDAEKYSNNSEDKGFDSQLCWAAAASEMLWLSGWAGYILPDAKTVDDVFRYYQENFTDEAGEPVPGLSYLFNGNIDNNAYEYDGIPGTAQVKPGKFGNADTTNTANVDMGDIASGYISMANNLDGISVLDRLASQSVGTFLRWMDKEGNVSKSAHWLTAVGVIIDTTTDIIENRYKAIILADSDNDGRRLEDSPSVHSEGFTEDIAYEAKVGKPNSYTVYGLSTAYDNQNNKYWTISNYLGNTTTKAILTGFEYLVKAVFSTDDGLPAGSDVIPEDYQDMDVDREELVGPVLWEDDEYWSDEDIEEYRNPNKKEDEKEPSKEEDKKDDGNHDNKPSDNSSNKPNNGYGQQPAQESVQYDNRATVDELVEDAVISTGYNNKNTDSNAYADVDVALRAAKIAIEIDKLSASGTQVYYAEKKNYIKGTDAAYEFYIKGSPELIEAVYIDGVKLTAGDFKIVIKKNNVVQIIVSKAVLDKLAKGSHMINISYFRVTNPVSVEIIVE